MRVREPIAASTRQDPAEAAVLLVRAGLSEEYVVYERDGVWHYAGVPAAEIVADADTVRVRTRGRSWTVPAKGDPLRATGAVLAGLPLRRRAYGWAAFELAHLLHGTGSTSEPLVHVLVPELEVRCAQGTVSIHTDDTELEARAQAALGDLAEVPVRPVEAWLDFGADAYREAVSSVVRDIADGRLLKAVLSRSVPLPASVELDFPATYLAGRAANTPARSFLLDLGGWQVAGFSPETVAEVDASGLVSTQPLAGTRGLGPDQVRNELLRAELLVDPKEVHEHAVSVRLACAELAGVCEPESVVIREFLAVRERGSVQHLASRVAGQLTGSAWDAFAALFPAVTATGVNKADSLRTLAKYEDGPRGLYGGSVFTVGPDGSLDAALVLRSVFSHRGRTWLRAGAGVVGQSSPEREVEETREKLRSVAPYLRARTS